jgi:single-stranded-DNA-specific exonuclease
MNINILKPDYEIVKLLSKKLRLSEIIAKLLVNREINNLEDAQKFLYGDLESLYSPEEMCGITDAVERIKKAINDNEKIVIYGDYDVDGVTSISILYKFFSLLGKKVSYYIPDRTKMGYGLNNEAIKEFSDSGHTLLITVDCGIGNIDEIKYAQSLGMDVIVTDHHEIPEERPSAIAIINPKNGNYPFKYLAGVGVAFKLFQKLLEEFEFSKDYLYQNMDLVSLGTIADIVPLIDENRIIARYGLKKMAKTDNLGLRELINATGLKKKKITSGQIAFVLAPKINACGRIDDPLLAVRLLTTDNKEEANFLAGRLNEINRTRQKIEGKIMYEAEEYIEKYKIQDDLALVLHSENWHSGVIGVVTSKLKERYNRPVVMIAIEDSIGKASARSIPGFLLHQELKKCDDLLEKFGGHEMAAGFTIKLENIETFRKKFNELVSNSIKNIEEPTTDIDCELEFTDINFELAKKIEGLGPFGMKNPIPKFYTSKIFIERATPVGVNKRHLKLKVSKDGTKFDAIAFNKGYFHENIYSQAQLFDIVYQIEVNYFNNLDTLQLNIIDIEIHNEFFFGG